MENNYPVCIKVWRILCAHAIPTAVTKLDHSDEKRHSYIAWFMTSSKFESRTPETPQGNFQPEIHTIHIFISPAPKSSRQHIFIGLQVCVRTCSVGPVCKPPRIPQKKKISETNTETPCLLDKQ